MSACAAALWLMGLFALLVVACGPALRIPALPAARPRGSRLAALVLFGLAGAAQANVDLLLNQEDSPDPVAAGGVVVYTLRVDNNGTTPATGVELINAIPATAEYVSHTTTQGTCTPPASSAAASAPSSTTSSPPSP